MFMKNTLSISAAANLRRDPENPAEWRRAGSPRQLATSEALPIAEISLAGSAKAVLLTAGTALYVASAEAPADPLAAPRFFLGMLGGEPLEADTSVSGVVKLYCRRSAPEYVTYTPAGEFSLRGPLPELPPLAVHASESSTRYIDVSGTKLTGATRGRTDSSIADYDLSIITPKLLRGYTSMKLTAKQVGGAAQPVLARYRLRDIFGQTVYLSAPVLLAAPGGFQAAGDIKLSSADSMGSLAPGFFQFDYFNIAVTAPESLPAPWDSIVASAEIEVSPQLDPVDTEGVCQGAFTPMGGTTAQASVSLPGIPRVESARQALFRSIVTAALARAENLLKPVAKIGRPFGGTLGAPGSDKYVTTPSEYIGLDALSAIPATPIFIPGATHTARLSSDGISLRANPARDLPRPEAAATLTAAASTTEGSWKAAVAVTVKRGAFPETLVRQTSSGRALPLTLGPLLVYPDPAAVELSVNIQKPDGSALARTFPLTPVPEAGLSYWIDPALARVATPAAPFGYEVPMESFESSPEERVLEVYVADSELPADTARFDSGLLAMAGAPRARSAWDFSRHRVFCFGPGGSEILIIDAKGAVRSRSVVDRRPVTSPLAVAPAGTDAGASLLAVAGGDLLRFSASKVETLLPRCGASRPGWCPAFSEIWLFGGDGSPHRLTAQGEKIAAELDGFDSSAVCRLWRGRLLVGSAGRLFDASDELPAPSLPFRIALDAAVDRKPRALRASIFAESVDGELLLYGHNGSGIFGRLERFRLGGQLNAPLRLPLVLPARRFLRLSAEGSASPDLRITGFTLDG